MSRQLRWLGRSCGWCGKPLLATRVDAIYCDVRCRQAGNRANICRAELRATARPLRLAYADPPYPGNARRYYGSHPDFAGEVDLDELIRRLSGYDGWALSTSARALPDVLARCVAGGQTVRVAAWVKGARPHPDAAVVNGWEPVIYRRPARRVARRRDTSPLQDVLLGVSPRRRPTLPTAVIGMKPPAFCAWMFRLLGAAPGDILADLYPGSGIVARSWRLYTGLPPAADASPLAAAPRDTSHGSVVRGSRPRSLHDASRRPDAGNALHLVAAT